MGMTRKALSISTLGLVDFRSDKERTAAYTAGIRRQARKQTKLQRDLTKAANIAPPAPPIVVQAALPPAVPGPGWFPDGQGQLRWWDGQLWTAHTHQQ